MQTKLTLRMDKELIRDMKLIAEKKGQSISKMVADYFRSLKEIPDQKEIRLTPTVKSLQGALRGKKINREDYHRYLEEKYS